MNTSKTSHEDELVIGNSGLLKCYVEKQGDFLNLYEEHGSKNWPCASTNPYLPGDIDWGEFSPEDIAKVDPDIVLAEVVDGVYNVKVLDKVQ